MLDAETGVEWVTGVSNAVIRGTGMMYIDRQAGSYLRLESGNRAYSGGAWPRNLQNASSRELHAQVTRSMRRDIMPVSDGYDESTVRP